MNDIIERLNFVQVLIIAKRARYGRAKDYSLNIKMQIESNLLSAEIDALEEEEKRLTDILANVKEEKKND